MEKNFILGDRAVNYSQFTDVNCGIDYVKEVDREVREDFVKKNMALKEAAIKYGAGGSGGGGNTMNAVNSVRGSGGYIGGYACDAVSHPGAYFVPTGDGTVGYTCIGSGGVDTEKVQQTACPIEKVPPMLYANDPNPTRIIKSYILTYHGGKAHYTLYGPFINESDVALWLNCFNTVTNIKADVKLICRTNGVIPLNEALNIVNPYEKVHDLKKGK